jgi:hypothetical protein
MIADTGNEDCESAVDKQDGVSRRNPEPYLVATLTVHEDAVSEHKQLPAADSHSLACSVLPIDFTSTKNVTNGLEPKTADKPKPIETTFCVGRRFG